MSVLCSVGNLIARLRMGEREGKGKSNGIKVNRRKKERIRVKEKIEGKGRI